MKYLKFTVEGLCTYGIGETKIQKKYQEDFVLPEQSVSEARSIIQKRLIIGRLRDTVEHYRGWRTCQITNSQDATKKEIDEINIPVNSIGKLSMGELCQLAVNYKLKVDPARVSSLEEARWRVEEELSKVIDSKTTQETKAKPKPKSTRAPKKQDEEFSKE